MIIDRIGSVSLAIKNAAGSRVYEKAKCSCGGVALSAAVRRQ
jgi:hypothetical protein